MSYGFSPIVIGLLEFYSLHDRRAFLCVPACVTFSSPVSCHCSVIPTSPRLGHGSVMDVAVQNDCTACLTDFSLFAWISGTEMPGLHTTTSFSLGDHPTFFFRIAILIDIHYFIHATVSPWSQMGHIPFDYQKEAEQRDEVACPKWCCLEGEQLSVTSHWLSWVTQFQL